MFVGSSFAQNIYPEDGWWWNPDLSGRGFLLERQGDIMFMSTFHYNDSGLPVWLTVQGIYTPADVSTDNVGVFDGTVFESTDGQTIGGDYIAPTTIESSQTDFSMTFQDNQNAILNWSNETIELTRLFWSYGNNLDQLSGTWLIATVTPTGQTSAQVADIEIDGNTGIISSNNATIGLITLEDGDLTLELSASNDDLPILVPETKRFFAGSRDGSTDSIIGIKTDDLPLITTPESNQNPSNSLDPSFFLEAGLASEITTESCTLSGGTTTTCYRIEIVGEPAGHDIGPFCPPSIDSTAEEGGIWFDGGGEVYDIDGDFIVDLPNIYSDSNWQLFDESTGLVKVTDTQESCEAAAQPQVPQEFQNFCVECSLEYTNGGLTETYLIPTNPVPLASTSNLGRSNIGVSLTGIGFAPPAPVDNILRAYTIAAFDDCGGHINPVAGYHYHGSTGCTETVTQDDGHAALLGYALDGYAIYAMLNADGEEDNDLDECRGHTDDVRGYHYHSASAAENMFIGCYKGEQGSVQ